MAFSMRKSIPLAMAFLFLLASPSLAGQPLTEFSRLVRKDTTLTGADKLVWIRAAKTNFDSRNYRTDYSQILYRYLKLSTDGRFGVSECLHAARAAVEAAELGAKESLLCDMGELALGYNLSKEQLFFHYSVLERAGMRGVPAGLGLDLLAHGLAVGWNELDYHQVLDGVAKLVAQSVAPDLAALYIHYWESRLSGPPKTFVAKAVESIPESSKGSLHRLPEQALSVLADFRTCLAPWLGTPYLWGGISQEGADCSGFTKEILSNVGCTIPRVSRDQAKIGRRIKVSDMQPGDLIFFDMELKGLISHVGLYLGGDLMAHASSSRGVIIIPFSNSYFQRRFVMARRVLTQEADKPPAS